MEKLNNYQVIKAVNDAKNVGVAIESLNDNLFHY
jgi:hypothetical protein